MKYFSLCLILVLLLVSKKIVSTSNEIEKLNPSLVFSEFINISNIPRCSKNEKNIIEYLKLFSKKNNFEIIIDEYGK
jgi:hypothetical protein